MKAFRFFKYRSDFAMKTKPLIAACSLLAASYTPLLSAFQYQGVMTQGMAYTSDNNFYGESDDAISTEFTELSLSASHRLNSKFRAAVQGIYRHVGATDEGVDLDYALIDYQYFNSLSRAAGIRFGRYKKHDGIYNVTRDIAFTRPSMILAQSMYNDTLRDAWLSSDGIELYTNHFTNAGDLTLSAGYGLPRIENTVGRRLFTRADLDDRDGAIDGERAWHWSARYESANGNWVFLLGQSAINTDYASKLDILPGLIADLDVVVAAKKTAISLQYNWDVFSLVAEYRLQKFTADLHASINSNPIPSRSRKYIFDSESYYLQLSHRISQRVSLIYRWDTLFDDKDDRGGNYWASVGQPRSRAFSKDYSVGVRFEITDSLLFMGQLHYIDGTAILSAQDNPDTSAYRPYWHMLAASLSYRF